MINNLNSRSTWASNGSIGADETSAGVCPRPIIQISVLPEGMEGVDPRSFCLMTCCVSCPPQSIPASAVPWLTEDTFFPQYARSFEVVDIINLLSLTLVLGYCLLWLTVLRHHQIFRVRNGFIVATAFALVLWHIPGFIILVATPDRALCENPITWASYSNRICSAQGKSISGFLSTDYI